MVTQFLHCHNIYVGPVDVSRKRKTQFQLARNTQQHEQTGRAAQSQPQGKLPLQIIHAQGDKTRGASAPREERKGGRWKVIVQNNSFLYTTSEFD